MDKDAIKSAMEEVLDERRPVNLETVEACMAKAVGPLDVRLARCETKLDLLPINGKNSDRTTLAAIASNRLAMWVLLLVIGFGVLGFGRNLIAVPGAESKPNAIDTHDTHDSP